MISPPLSNASFTNHHQHDCVFMVLNHCHGFKCHGTRYTAGSHLRCDISPSSSSNSLGLTIIEDDPVDSTVMLMMPVEELLFIRPVCERTGLEKHRVNRGGLLEMQPCNFEPQFLAGCCESSIEKRWPGHLYKRRSTGSP